MIGICNDKRRIIDNDLCLCQPASNQFDDQLRLCRDHFAEFSYLRAADKKLNIPEHIEKTVLFLVDPSPVTTADPEGQNQDGKAEAAKAAEEEAAAAVKAAWRTAKDAKEVGDLQLFFCQGLGLLTSFVVVVACLVTCICSRSQARKGSIGAFPFNVSAFGVINSYTRWVLPSSALRVVTLVTRCKPVCLLLMLLRHSACWLHETCTAQLPVQLATIRYYLVPGPIHSSKVFV